MEKFLTGVYIVFIVVMIISIIADIKLKKSTDELQDVYKLQNEALREQNDMLKDIISDAINGR
ncbi:hypothetical protein PMF13cell1_05605 [Blautia producta]|uniref:Uncharacterized protein n=1 Tax=Blautia producta TaxID=33035 RepID=A0A4P6M5F0_9FIRM|nr:hypothetical protein [Blautia producta]QBF00010.1 hypothetical protein PMF13cell1_05605 [Blautia producta]